MSRRLWLLDTTRAGPLRRAGGLLVTFHLVLLAWVFFRADSLRTAFSILHRIAVSRGPVFWDPIMAPGLLGISLVVGLDLFNRRFDYWKDPLRFPAAFRFGYSLFLLFGVILLGVEQGSQFIYFQF
jgi:hypothetical protein